MTILIVVEILCFFGLIVALYVFNAKLTDGKKRLNDGKALLTRELSNNGFLHIRGFVRDVFYSEEIKKGKRQIKEGSKKILLARKVYFIVFMFTFMLFCFICFQLVNR